MGVTAAVKRRKKLLALLGLAALILSLPAAAQNGSYAPDRLPACSDAHAPITSPCVLPGAIDARDATRRLGTRDHIWWVEGDRVAIVARPAEPVSLCCSVQTPLEPIAGTGLATVTVRIPRFKEAILEIGLYPMRFYQASESWRGPDAPPAPPRADPPAGHMTVYDFPSKILGENRKITIYVPPGVPKGRKLPVMYLADNPAADLAPITEAAIKAGKLRPIILVGIAQAMPERNCNAITCNRRAMEYVLDANHGDSVGDNPFTRHMRFVTQEVVPYVEANFPALKGRANRAVGGSSNGGDWAMAAAALHPDLFGNVMALSLAARSSALEAGQLSKARLFFGSGILEPDFLRTTQAALARAKAAGAQTQADMLVTGHSPQAWDVMFADAEVWLFPGGKKAASGG